jgi:hypothetical protein
MQRDLERRLQALETTWFGSPKIAAFIGATDKEEPGEDFRDTHLRHFSDAELNRAIKDNDLAIRVHKLLDGTE